MSETGKGYSRPRSSSRSATSPKSPRKSPSKPKKDVRFDEAASEEIFAGSEAETGPTMQLPTPDGKNTPSSAKETPENQDRETHMTPPDESARKLTPFQQRMKEAQAAIGKLQSPSDKPSDGRVVMKWDPKNHPDVVNQNLKVMLAIAREIVRHYLEDADDAEAANKRRKHEMKKGKKKRMADEITKDGDEKAEPALADRDAERKLKKMKMMVNKGKRRPSVDLVKLAPQPIRISYMPHPHGDRDDQFFITQFKKLSREAVTVSSTFFAAHDLSKEGDGNEPWAIKMDPKFYLWAERVTEPDENTGGWDEILKDTTMRKWLVMGILLRVLKWHVFDIDLFGANMQQEQMMHTLEKTLVFREGFSRTELRASTVRTIIGPFNAVTPMFYSEMAKLTARIALLLKPVTDYLYCRPTISGEESPSIESQYQSIHNLVSKRRLSISCVRLSRTIFHFVEISPGEYYSPDDQENIAMESWSISKDEELRNFKARQEFWLKRKGEAEQAFKTLEEAGQAHTRKGKKATDKLLKIRERQPKPPQQTHRAKTKIGVWPVITRYKPGSDKDDEDDEEGRTKALVDKDGFRIMEISKSAVVCYYGKVREERRRIMRLQDFVERKQREFGRKEGGLGKYARMMMLAGGAAA